MTIPRRGRRLCHGHTRVLGLCLRVGAAGLLGLFLLVATTQGFLQTASASDSRWVADAEPSATLRLIESNWQRVVLELQTPVYTIEPSTTGSALSHSIFVPGLSTLLMQGMPALPAKNVLLGIPPGAGVEVELLELETEVLAGNYRIKASPSPIMEEDPAGWLSLAGQSYEESPAVYLKNGLYPEGIVRAEPLGYVRYQRIARIALYPFQFNPALGQLVYHPRIRVAVNFVGARNPDVAAPGVVPDDGFDQVLANLLFNHSSARAWRAAGPPSTEPVTVTPRTGEPSCKITVEQDGIYVVTYSDLQEAGCLMDAVDPRFLHMYNQGQEVAIQVVGEEDGVFDPGDVLRFFGQGIDSKYTKENVYWLVTEISPAVRMETVDGSLKGSPPLAGPFLSTVRVEQDRVYWGAPTPTSGRDYWFWERLYATPTKQMVWDHTVTLPFQASGAFAAALRVAVKSRYDQPGQDPDHHLKIYLNDVLVADTAWNGEKVQVVNVQKSQSILRPGPNALRLVMPCDQGAPFDAIYLDWFEVDYYRTHETNTDALAFSSVQTGPSRYAVGGFSDAKIELFDVSQPAVASQVVSTTVSFEDDAYTLAFQSTTTSPRRYLALAEDQLGRPTEIAAGKAPSLRSTANGADYVLITHADLDEAAQMLAEHRRTSGYRVKVVNVQDIYDEFGYGIREPEAIRDFLSYAFTNWQRPAPSYVLLLGDGHRDFHDNLGTGEISYIPPYLAQVDPWLGETSSDNRYVAVSGDDPLPDMHIGRLPASNPAEAAKLVAKIIGYEEASHWGGWTERVTLVADDKDDVDDFAAASDAIAQHIPPSYEVARVYYGVTETDARDAADAIVHSINSGSLLVNYVGHGAVQYWAGERLLTIPDIDRLANDRRLPLVLPWTCYDGLFDFPGYPSLGESIVRAGDRGAVASWSPTGLGLSAGHQVLADAFLDALFSDPARTLGPATTQAKLSMWAQVPEYGDLVDTYLLFGDPATSLHAARPYRAYLPLGLWRYTAR